MLLEANDRDAIRIQKDGGLQKFDNSPEFAKLTVRLV